jgi:ribulose-phosphate 3-epimerase
MTASSVGPVPTGTWPPCVLVLLGFRRPDTNELTDGTTVACQDHRMGWQEWIRTVEIEPALEARDVAMHERDLEGLLRTGCRIIHVDAPPAAVRTIVAMLQPMMRKYEGVLDFHLRGDDFAELDFARADSVTFDANSVDDVPGTIDALRGSATQVGVAFGHDFDPEIVAPAAEGADLVLCALGHDDLGGVDRLRRLAVRLPPAVALQVEGGVTYDNVRALYEAGARLLVADQPIFEREDLPRAYRRLVQALA